MNQKDLSDLRAAKHLLEDTTLAIRLTSAIGRPVEKGLELLPANWRDTVHDAAHKALEAAFKVALTTLDAHPRSAANNRLHKVLVGMTGAGGGAFGLAALAMELPVSTTIMLRSVADIARGEGEDLRLTETKLACLEVFALGGRSSSDDAAESGYFVARAALAKAVSEAAAFISERGLVREGAPAIVQLISRIAGRFSVAISEKAAAQALPMIGAVGGAAINLLFIDHFQNVAKGHFTIRRLERVHGTETVRAEYLRS